MDMELQPIQEAPNNNNGTGQGDEVTSGNGTCSNHNMANATENSNLLEVVESSEVAMSKKQPSTHGRVLARMKKELNDEVVCKLKLWMIILLVVLFIFVVIFLSIILCAVHYEDEDEKYDRSLFVKKRFFFGNFTLNQTFEVEALSQTPAVGALFTQLQQKVTDVYSSSSALGRYFSQAEINMTRESGSVEFKLVFLMPEDDMKLQQYILSREVVYSVLLQQLQDQDKGDPLYIKPSSLSIQGKASSKEERPGGLSVTA